MNKFDEIISIDEDFNSSINCLIKSSKSLIILRKKDLSMIQSNGHDKIDSNFNELDLTFVLSFRDVVNLKSFEGRKM